MPKHGFLTPKAIGNRIKAKGLQKLKWYCQMCEKQCRDENGFKCHMKSEGHLRQMRVFSENAGGIIDKFSKEFLKNYMDILSHRHGIKRTFANKVYQEVVADKQHIHMNATCWSCLSEFVKYLGKESYCVVDEDERGWWVTYIDRDPTLKNKRALHGEQMKREEEKEEKNRRSVEKQVAEASRMAKEKGEVIKRAAPTELQREDDKKIELKMGIKSKEDDRKRLKLIDFAIDTEDEPQEMESQSTSRNNGVDSSSGSSPSSSTGAGIDGNGSTAMANHPPVSHHNITENWIRKGILVKVLNKKVGDGRFYKKKGEIVRIIDDFIADVKMEGATIRLDQDDLETVIPKVGGKVLLLNGKGRGLVGQVAQLNPDDYSVDIDVSGEIIIGVLYEYCSKVA